MHDSPSSPRRSIAPAPPKQHQPKKAGAPKAKGAVRAKSGCYTCRIRRKKCDERPNPEGRCETCIRLRLQCLGFGQKRPDWLKENNNVTMFREKIKDFLAAQGMIKGHSGSGTRTSDQEGMLVLVTDHGRSDTSSPHSPALSIDSTEDRRHSGHNISSLRHDPHYPSISLAAQHSHPGYSSQQQQRMSFSSARESSPLNLPRLPSAYHALPDMSADAREGMNSELILPFSPPPTSSNILPPPPTSLVSPMSQSWHHSNQNPYPSYSAPPVPPPSVPVPPPPPPQTQLPIAQVPAHAPASTSHFASTLSPSYHQHYVYEEDEYNNNNNETEQVHSTGYYVESSSLSQNIAPFMSSHQSGLVRHYLDHVLRRQYLLADTSIAEFIIRTVQENPAVRDAVCLLASLHRESLRHGPPHFPAAAAAAMTDALVLQNDASSDYSKTYKRICTNLRTSAAAGYTEGEAMAGLFVVSAFLFRGGRGAWQEFLSVAADWVWNVLHAGGEPAETILRCSDSQQFIIKTTFWFDILASTTRLQTPRFLSVYRELWSSRRGAYIENGGARQLSMMSVMGCENSTALALAEISALACWKETHARQGTLSVPELVDRGRTIESECLVHPSPTPAHPSLSGVAGGGDGRPGAAGLYGGAGDADAELAEKRRLTADIFRATARVYLHSVLSGEYPGCPEIRDGVQDTIECLRRVPAGGHGPQQQQQQQQESPGQQNNVSRSVLRSVVFGICLCGCLTDDYTERQFLLRRLDEEQAEGVGNCAEARSVMEQVWNRRASVSAGSGGGSSLSWRDAMQQFGGESLLLV
ncbi:fungal-specific transcription factor domain-containing protein [Lactarius hengduanensis]|nr:fungal-specific transcription factor domain-containing protein [Lactarius hengduanensis]